MGAIGTVERYSTGSPQTEGLNNPISTVKEKMQRRMNDIYRECISIIKFVIKAFLEEVGAISTME